MVQHGPAIVPALFYEGISMARNPRRGQKESKPLIVPRVEIADRCELYYFIRLTMAREEFFGPASRLCMGLDCLASRSRKDLALIADMIIEAAQHKGIPVQDSTDAMLMQLESFID